MSGRTSVSLLALGAWVFVAGIASTAVRRAGAVDALREDKIRVLLVTGGHDFEREPFLALFAAMPDAEISEVTYPDAAGLLTRELAGKYDVVVFYDMWVRGIAPAQQKGFLELLREGIGVVALHHTLVAHEDWPEYAQIIGGKYYLQERTVDGKVVPGSAFAHDQDMRVHVAAPDHPITRGLGDFEIHDEAYCRYDVDPAATILLTTDHPKSEQRLAWVKTYANSRVCYVQLGHDQQAYNHPSYRLLVARAIRWTAGRPTDADVPAVELFNGTDLSGWAPEGKAVWDVNDGALTGRQGPGNTAGDLLTTASYDDFEATVTLRVVWPANSGVWFRYQSADKAYQADVLEYKDPVAWSGSLYCPGKMFLAINKDPKIVDREGWNTFVIRAVGNRLIVFLNGTKVADVRDGGSDKGRIGFQIHPGDEFEKMRLFVKNVRLRPL